MQTRGRRLLSSVFALAIVAVAARADEGMWLYNKVPKDLLQKKYNFDASDAWLDHLMKSSVRFSSGGSGSFISSTGLVITNHHVASDTLAKVSTPENDLYKDGFYADTPEKEIKATDLELDQLESIEDVTDRVLGAVKPGMTDAQAAAAKKTESSKIQEETFAQTGLRGQVVSLYQGARFNLYRYHRYEDVRIVFAPEFQAAFFGGDNDNFEFPRHDLDIAIFRVYENGKPISPANYLKFATTDVKEGDLTFVSGHPGSTSRMLTTQVLEYLRDFGIPFLRNVLYRQESSLLLYSKQGGEEARQAKKDLFSVQNSRKVYDGRIKGLGDPTFFQGKQGAELSLKSQASDEESQAWDKIAAAQPEKRKLLAPYNLLERGIAFRSQLFSYAKALRRWEIERQKSNGERLPEFQEASLDSLKTALFAANPVYKEYEINNLRDSLQILVDTLGKSKTYGKLVAAVLAGQSPDERARKLVEGSWSLAEPKIRERLFAKGTGDLSYAPMFALVDIVDKAARKIRTNWEAQVEKEQQGYGQIAKVLFRIKGDSLYPDATFTLRLAFGTVTPYTSKGATVPVNTTLAGLYEAAAKHPGDSAYAIPQRWLEKKDKLNLATPFNFISTADIIGGNSGSPIVNRAGEFAGIIFDGNIESLTADYAYDDVKSRAVSVNVGAIVEALTNVYETSGLLAEIQK